MRLFAYYLPAVALILFILGGCQSSTPGYLVERDVEPLNDRDGQARSLALTSPVVQSVQAPHVAYEPWYAGRNDIGRSVFAGYVLPTYQTSVTYTRDRQHSSNGRVYDHYHQTTYRRTYRQVEY